MRLKPLDIFLLLYGGLVLIGGVLGYIEKQSIVSLISGCIAELLIAVGVVVSQKNRSLGYGICFLVAGANLAFFTYRFSIGGQPFPALPVIVLSALVIAVLIQAHFADRRNAA